MHCCRKDCYNNKIIKCCVNSKKKTPLSAYICQKNNQYYSSHEQLLKDKINISNIFNKK